jgi:hypothetical protein
MLARIHPLARLAGAAAIAALTVVPTTGSAQAASPWLNDPNSCTGQHTVVGADVEGRRVEVRVGNCNGRQYGWGRIRGYDSSEPDYIRFEVDVNGDRRPDGHSWRLARQRNYTAAYPTSSSPSRAFRACFVKSRQQVCNSRNSTRWW